MKHEIKYFSLFTGVGGFELGFAGQGRSAGDTQPSSSDGKNKPRRSRSTHQSGALLHHRSNASLRSGRFRCVGFSEIDKFASRVLRHRFPKIKNYGDITKINVKDLPNFDLLCGGFPCQAFSIAGKRNGFKDSRGSLFFEIARILKAKRPSLVLLENVKGLLNHESGKTFRVIVQTLGELGYDVQWMVFNSKFFGTPQNRERVFLVGSLRGKSRPQILPFGEGAEAAAELRGQQTNTIKAKGGTPTYIAECQQLPETKGRAQGARIYKTSGISKTLVGKGGGSGGNTGIYQEGTRARRLTPKECERLQGFPENWTTHGVDENGELVLMSDSQRYKQMGNAVTVNVIQTIAEQLAKIRIPRQKR